MKKSNKIEREKEFHNNRFSIENRQHQKKYYYAIKNGVYEYYDKIKLLSSNATVLEYGSGLSSIAHSLANIAYHIDSIDISEIAIEKLKSTHHHHNIKYIVMNAEDLRLHNDNYDLVFGSGIIHHLDTDKAWHEISKVLKKGGKAIFWEPLGHNPLFNLYRMITPKARTVDEHPLLKNDIKLGNKYFTSIKVRHFGLFSLVSVPFRKYKIGKVILYFGSLVDRLLLKLPIIKWFAWYSLIELEK